MALNINGTTGISGVDGSASAPALQGTDSNTGVSFGTDTVNINTGGSTRATIDSNGRLGIGTTSPSTHLEVSGTTDGVVNLNTTDSRGTFIRFRQGGSNKCFVGCGVGLGVGSVNDLALVSDSQHIIFKANGSERMRILSDGTITTNGNSSLPTGSTQGFGFSSDQFYLSYTGTGANYSQRFYNGNGLVGSILVNGSSTSYNTSSDYRLKENASVISDGITRLKELKPYKFNFKADKSKTLDGFFAHEAQAVVPESATGVKDELDSDNNPVYQGIDQSKLVPLLTAALQEAIAKIEVLETKVAALEAG